MSSATRPAGPFAEEAARLLHAVQEWARRGPAGPAAGPADAAACRWCPVCQAARVAGEAGPEVLAHLADAAHEVARAVEALVRARAEAAPPAETARPDPEPADSGSAGTDPAGGPAPRVQHIDIA